MLGTVFTVGLGTAGTVMASTQNAVVTKNGETKKVYMLTSSDTNNILKTAGVHTNCGDMILRSTNAQGNIEVSVRTAYPVKVKVDGTTKTVTAHYGDTARDILAEGGVTLGPVDTVNVPLNRPVEENAVMRVMRNHIVTVAADGMSRQVVTAQDTPAQQVVQLAGVKVGGDDELSTDAASPVTENQTIAVNRVTYKDEVISQAIPFQTVTQDDDTLLTGTTKVKTEGSDGQKKIVRRTKYINGKASGTNVVSTSVVKNSVNKIVLQGTKEPPKQQPAQDTAVDEQSGSSQQTTAGGISYSSVLTGQCTAYTGGGITASGMPAAVGRVAVNPNVIPYGTRLYIASPDGSYVYGYAIAADTGGFVNSSSTMVDLYMNSEAECENFGRRAMNIYILN
ncbi:MAG: G5 domain-containing protein [Oscillospiraceae bacterium]|nr:G5 domain-containing protein [Oscillospiraceae bacterium]